IHTPPASDDRKQCVAISTLLPMCIGPADVLILQNDATTQFAPNQRLSLTSTSERKLTFARHRIQHNTDTRSGGVSTRRRSIVAVILRALWQPCGRAIRNCRSRWSAPCAAECREQFLRR